VSSFTVRQAGRGDAEGIRRLHARVFGSEMTESEWEWKFDRNPDGRFGTVAVAGGEIVGNYAGWGARFLLGGRPAPVYGVGDVATEPSTRGLGGRHGVYRSMADSFYGALAGVVPFCFGFPNDRALTISNRLAGTRTLFPIRHALVDLSAFPPPPPGAGSGDFVGEGFDPLWEEASRHLTHAAVRDRARVNWRFHARPNRYYRMVWWAERGTWRGWAALSVVGENALVADFLGSDPEGRDLPVLFAVAAAEAGKLRARRLVFWEPPGGPARRVLDRFPGERAAAGYSMIARVLDEERFSGTAERLHLVPSLYDVV
jgi:Acetyltransferase (GNAT) domain